MKQFIKYIYTWFFNWFNIIRFKNFGKDSFIGRRFTMHLSGNGIWIGDNVRIGSDCRFSCYYAPGHTATINVKKSVYMGSNVSILTADTVVIEEDVLMASYINILGEQHGMNPESDIKYGSQELSSEAITIKKGCWIGQNVTIIGGKSPLTIGERCIIGGGSVVVESVPDYCIAVGNPAHVIKKYNFNRHLWEKI